MGGIDTHWQATLSPPSATSTMQLGHVLWSTHMRLAETPDHLKPLVLSYMHFCI